MNDEQIKELFSDEVFVNSLFELDEPEDVQKALAAKGLNLSLEEISVIRNSLQNENTDELSEDELESVSGGVAVTAVVGAIIIAVSAVAGAGALAKKVTQWTNRRW